MADRVVFPQYNDPTPAPELASQQYETLGGAMDAYLDPEAAQPGSMRMFASNLYDLMGGEDDVVGDAENAARFVQGARDEDAVMGAISTGLNLADYIPGGSLISAIIPSKILKKWPEKAFRLTPADVDFYKDLLPADRHLFDDWVTGIKKRLAGTEPSIKKMRVNEYGEPEYYDLVPGFAPMGTAGYTDNLDYLPTDRTVDKFIASPIASHTDDILSVKPSFDYEMPLVRAQKSPLPPSPIVKLQRGTQGGGVVSDAVFGPGLYARKNIAEVYPGYGENVFKIIPKYQQTPENVMRSYQTFATVPSVEMREKLLTLYGPDIASEEFRHVPLADLLPYPNRPENQSAFFDELRDLGVDEIQHIDWIDVNTPSSAVLGEFHPIPVSEGEINRSLSEERLKSLLGWDKIMPME